MNNWKPGDRVYYVALPELTGTVRTVDGAHGQDVSVQWDQPGWGITREASALLEWYTLPEAA
jgi:hypothetical protein